MSIDPTYDAIEITEEHIGRTVRLRNGDTRVIDRFRHPNTYPVYAGQTSWASDGRFDIDQPDYPLDIIEILPPSDFTPQPDPINPPHYKQHPSGVECIEITQHFGFCLGNAIKYIWRAGEKGSKVEDLRKAIWYLEREIAKETH